MRSSKVIRPWALCLQRTLQLPTIEDSYIPKIPIPPQFGRALFQVVLPLYLKCALAMLPVAPATSVEYVAQIEGED